MSVLVRERALAVERKPLGLVVMALVLAACGLVANDGLQLGLLIAAAAAAALVPVASAAARGRVDPLEIGVAVALAYFVLFPLRAALVLLGWDDAVNSGVTSASYDVVRDALVVIVLGLAAGGLGYAIPLGARLAAHVRIPRVDAAERPNLALVLTLFLIGGAAQSLIFAASASQDAALIGSRESGLISSASTLMLMGLCLFARRAALSRRRADIAWLVAAMLLAASVSFIGQFKEVAILALLAPLVMWNFTGSRALPLRWVVVAAVGAVFIVFPIVTVWRQTSIRAATTNPVVIVPKLPGEVLDHGFRGGQRRLQPWEVLSEPIFITSERLYGFDSMTLIVRYTPSLIPHQDGATLEGLVTGLVPRILWPGKPKVGVGYWFAVHYWGTPRGVPQVPQTVTHPGELFIDFGLPGVIVGMALLGLSYRVMYGALRPRESGTAALVYTILLLTVVVVDRDLPLVYVTLLQRMLVVGLLLGFLALLPRLRGIRA